MGTRVSLKEFGWSFGAGLISLVGFGKVNIER